MVPLVASLAGKLLGSAAEKVITALWDYIHRYSREDIELLETRLPFILRKLESLSDLEQTDDAAKKWITNARELVYDIEDIIGKFQSADHNKGKPADSIKNFFRGILDEIKAFPKYFSNAEEIKKAKYGVATEEEMFGTLYKDASGDDRRHCPLNVQNSAGLVGMDGPAKEIISLLDIAGVPDAKEGAKENSINIGHKVVAIVGVGGLGKTTLAAHVCNKIQGQFHPQAQARVFVTRNRRPREILKYLLQEFDSYDGKLDGADVPTLVRRIQEHVCDKRFLIIFDDVWNNDVLEDVNNALFGNPCGGRIIMTTRRNDVAEEWISYHEKENKGCCSTKWGGDYRIKPLNEEDSRKLLRKNVSPWKPQTSEEYIDTILAKCGGSPLALTAVSDVVHAGWRGRKIPWDEVYKRIIDIGAPREIQSMRKDLSHSYFDLPYDKRDCFLYLSLFPNDEINKKRLVSIWVAEGLIAKEEGKETFKKLVDSNLILKPKIKYDGDESIYQVHPSIHDFVVWKSAEYNFLTLPGAIDQTDRKIRRIFVHRNTEGREKINLGAKRLPHLRSLSMFGAGVPPENMSSVLRVLDMEGCTNGDADSEMVPSSEKKSGDIKPGELLHRNLRYLKLKEGLKGFDCHKFLENYLQMTDFEGLLSPEAGKRLFKPTKNVKRIGSAKNLQTLDLRGFGSIKLDKAVTDLECLARLLVDPETTLPGGIEKMKALEELELIDVSRYGKEFLVELGKLPKLRAMGIHLSAEISMENSLQLLIALNNLMEGRSLKSLSIDGVGIYLRHHPILWGLAIHGLEKFRMMMGCHFSKVPCIMTKEQKLRLGEFPGIMMGEEKLQKLRLGVTKMDESAIQALNAFTSGLSHLFLDVSGDITYNIANTRFKHLMCLGIRSSRLNMELRFSMGAPQHLKFQLHADDCTGTEDLPDGFYCATQHITSRNTIPEQGNHNNEQATTWTAVHIITPPRERNDRREVVVAIKIINRSATLSIQVNECREDEPSSSRKMKRVDGIVQTKRPRHNECSGGDYMPMEYFSDCWRP